MRIEAAFFVGSAIAMGIVSAVIWYLRNPVQFILTELCGRPERARFWSAFSHVTLFLIPFIAVLSRGPELPFGQSVVFAICEQIRAGMMGLVGSVVTLGVVLSVYIARYIVSPAGDIQAEARRHS
jgi:hypothetical protein